ncbi:YebC/PmpR family DNA-binding transcriptional regulator [Rubrivirga sp. S365]|uniref:Probable transcriptional regulatory protein RM540_00535 n=1 Tax=Rubrivirga litoralis TaxID=3075598 RepID=A0ABU3BLQ9_9BACT|nr:MULTISPECIES: YebC/PmpR family DNA-binding transcriptional regulator [unclassified Rubrivirga]MDT0630221.1 YebC/PmpR family DNA-binding transcriptional regulator [Rubrivirga sp. F394]MDT7855732.1 YebC/PmpR family DNA-binding transcriptional regulator [Rubrivirga sp. S365]
MGRMFEKRKHTMFARYDRMAKQFARIGKDIVIAVKAGGPDPDLNPQLRRAVQNAKGVNMPKEKVDAAIKRALGKDTASYDEVLYEGYGPHGVALLIDAATDNVNRTVANLRAVFSRGGGNLGTSGSVAFQFTKMGAFALDPDTLGDRDELELDLIDEGLESLEEGTTEDGRAVLVARCAFADFGQMQKALDARGVEPITAEVEYVPTTTTDPGDDAADDVLELVGKLEADEDVQRVFHNLA